MKLHSLSPIRFHILLAVATVPAHARLIATRVAYDTLGEFELSPATLHDNLIFLIRSGWIEPSTSREYSITDRGREKLQNDLYRWRIVSSRATEMLRRV